MTYGDFYHDGVLIKWVPYEEGEGKPLLSPETALRLEALLKKGRELLDRTGGEVAVRHWMGGRWRVLVPKGDEE